MKRLLLIALTVGLAAQPADATAQLFYQGIPDAQEYLRFISGSGYSAGGVQVGPYTGQFVPYTGVTEDPLHPAFNIYCVDYNHYARSQRVNVTALTPGALPNTRLGNPALNPLDEYSVYRKAAYLASLFHSPTIEQSRWGQIHAAIWYLTSGYAAGNNDYVTMANNNYQTFSTDGWYVLSPTSPHGPAFDGTGQEFLMRVSRVSVPEPTTLLLMATGLLLMAAFSRKRLAEVIREGM